MKIYKDFDLFTRALVNSKDVDPTYMVLKDIINHFGFDDKRKRILYLPFFLIFFLLNIFIWAIQI